MLPPTPNTFMPKFDLTRSCHHLIYAKKPLNHGLKLGHDQTPKQNMIASLLCPLIQKTSVNQNLTHFPQIIIVRIQSLLAFQEKKETRNSHKIELSPIRRGCLHCCNSWARQHYLTPGPGKGAADLPLVRNPVNKSLESCIWAATPFSNNFFKKKNTIF